MNIIGSQVELGIDEPWENSKVIHGKVISAHFFSKREAYFVIEDTIAGGVYIVSSRYEGNDLNDIISGEKVIVAIAIPQKAEYIDSKQNFLANLNYYGIGYISLLT
jgi:hypothetical protein